jgi:hypothetical protein
LNFRELEKSFKITFDLDEIDEIFSIRDIAQLGRAPALGAGCRRFKSYYPDNFHERFFEFFFRKFLILKFDLKLFIEIEFNF